MPLDAYFYDDLPGIITKGHVDIEVAKYPQHRPVVMLQCRSGWASYSAHDGTRITPFKSWSQGILDFADAVHGCIVEKTPAVRLTYRLNVPKLAQTEWRG
jgi:hypothetical protein